MKYAVFLRGVNIGGKNIVKMKDLISALAGKNFESINSYINSGNVVFRYNGDKKKVKEIITDVIESQFNLNIELFVKTEKEVEAIINKCPFNKDEADNSKRAVVLLSDKIEGRKIELFKDDDKIDENYYGFDDLLYIYYHNGAGRSRFTTLLIEKKLNVIAIGRNWNTIIKISEMLEELL